MPGIYGMAVLTLCVTAVLCITALDHLTRSDRRYYWLIVAGLPLSLIANRFLKIPAITSLAAWTGTPLELGPGAPLWFVTAVWLNAPIFEESIKPSRRFCLSHAPFCAMRPTPCGQEWRWEWGLVSAKPHI